MTKVPLGCFPMTESEMFTCAATSLSFTSRCLTISRDLAICAPPVFLLLLNLTLKQQHS